MNLLLDTHAFLWFVLGDTRLSGTAKAHIDDPSNEKLVSPASFWEIAIKVSLGKYTLSIVSVDTEFDAYGIARVW